MYGGGGTRIYLPEVGVDIENVLYNLYMLLTKERFNFTKHIGLVLGKARYIVSVCESHLSKRT